MITPFDYITADEARKLIAAGADVNAQAKYGWTPLHLAARSGRIETARILIASGADASIRNNEGKTPSDDRDPEIAHVFSSSGN